MSQDSKTADAAPGRFDTNQQATIKEWGAFLAGLRTEAERERAGRIACTWAGEPAEPPGLLSTSEAAAQTAQHADWTRNAILKLGYGDQLHRLGGSNSNSTECRAAVKAELTATYGWDEGYALSLIKQIVTGRDGGMLEDLDVCAPGATAPAKLLIEPLIYEKLLHSFVGPEGSNKTIFVIWLLAALAEQKRHVLLLEYEIAKAPIAQIIDELGFDREALRPYFHSQRPRVPFSEEVLWEVQAKYPELTALALDSMAEAILSRGDGDENQAADALKVLGPLSDYAHKSTAVIVVGHPGHGDATRERGSSAKGPAVDVRYQVAGAPAVTLERMGRLKFTCRKDRPARVGVGTELWYSIGSGEGDRRLPIEPIEKPGEPGLNAYQSAAIKALRTRAEQHPDDAWLSEKPVSKLAGWGRSVKHVDWLDELANDPRWSIERKLAKHAGNDAAYYRYAAGLGEADESGGLEV